MHYRRLTTGRRLGRRRTAAANRPTAAFVGETLETRTLLTTYFVDTTDDVVDADDGVTSLREAIMMAEEDAADDEIRFAEGLEGAVFNITEGPLPTITEDLAILGTIGNAQTINMAGLEIEADGAGTITTFGMNSVNINLNPDGAGLQIDATNDGVANVTVFNSRIANSATQGIHFAAHTGGVVNLQLNTVNVVSNGDVTQSEGIRGEIGLDPAGAESLTSPGNFATANLTFGNVLSFNHNLEGLALEVADGGIVTSAISNANFGSNGLGNFRSGVRMRVTDPGSSLQVDFDGTVAHNVAGAGYQFNVLNGGHLDLGMSDGAVQSSGSDAMNIMVDEASANVDVDGFVALTNGDNGVEGRFTRGSDVTVNSFNNVNVNGARRSGLKIGVLSGSTLNAFNATDVTLQNNGGAGDSSDGSGFLTVTHTGSVSDFNFTNLTTRDNQYRGVQIGMAEVGTSSVTFNNLVATGNRLSFPVGVGIRSGAMIDLVINGGNVTSAGAPVGGNNLYMTVSPGSTANLTVDGVSMDGSTSSGIVLDYTDAQGTVNISNTTSTGNNVVGVALFARSGSVVDAHFENVDLTGAGQNSPAHGMRLEVLGEGSVGNFTFDGVTVDGAGGAGISLVYGSGTEGSVDQFDNISAQNTGSDGVRVRVTGIDTTLHNFVASNVNVTGAGLGTDTDADGLDITLAGPGTTGNFDIQGLAANLAGGRGMKLRIENTATATMNLDGFSANGNQLEGIAVDVGTVFAGAQLLGAVFANGSASNNGTLDMQDFAGIRTTVHDPDNNTFGHATTTVADIAFDSVLVNSNSAEGISVTAHRGLDRPDPEDNPQVDVSVDLNGVTAVGNLGHGVNFEGDGPDTTVSLTSTEGGNAFIGNGGAGLNVLLADEVTAEQITVQGSATTNQGDGIRIADDGSGVTINSLQVSGNSAMDENLGHGLAIELNGAQGLTQLDLSSLVVTDNEGDQINVSLTDMSLEDILLNDVTATGLGIASGSGDGIELTLDNTEVTGSLGMSGITAGNNGEDGLQLNILNGAVIPAASVIDQGTFDGNGQDGIHLNIDASDVSLAITNSEFDMGSTASASNNGRHGLNIVLNNQADLELSEVDHLAITGNGGNGVNILAATPANLTSNSSFTNNQIVDNGGFGFRAVFNSGSFDIAIGDEGAGNIITGNNGSAIAIDMVQDTTGQLRIVDNVISGTTGADAEFDGQGIYIRQLGTVNPQSAINSLENLSGDPGDPGLLIQGNRIGVDALGAADGNDGFGITFRSEENSSINGLHILENEVSNNGNGGINFRRRDAVDVTDFIIDANQIQDNNGNGIGLFANNSALAGAMEVTIGRDMDGDTFERSDDIIAWLGAMDGNLITGNTNGLQVDVVTDSQVNVDLNENLIMDNVNGIMVTETSLSGDTRQVTGTWDQNVISNNNNRGILSIANVDLLVTDGIVGAVTDQFGQVIPGMDGNGSTGIEINRLGTFVIGQSGDGDSGLDIIRNGRLVQADRTQGHGIDIQESASKTVNVFNSRIRENFQDGVEILTDFSVMNILLEDNRIVSNVGRGVDALIRDDGQLNLTVQGTNDPRLSPGNALAQVSSNGEEGIYIVNTPANNQSQSDLSFVALDQDGPINDNPDTNALIDNVAINFNGNDVGNETDQLRPAGSGIVVRVGSSQFGGNSNISDPGGFASFGSGFATPTGRLNDRSGVVMQVSNNYLEGNVGEGMFFHGYRATAATNTGNAWPNDGDINNSGYQNDPLARLDLIWGVTANGTENLFAGGDQLNANNAGRRGTPGGQAGAFYQTDDGTFKSRDNSFDDTPGPFGNNSNRRRNAQRQGIRDYPGGTSLGPGTNSNFLYPGMGDSTFRVSSLSGDNADLPIAFGLGGFNLDSQSPVQGPGDINGTGFLGANTGELPFGWGTF